MKGVEEGVKDRPCAIIMAMDDGEGGKIVIVVPITHSEPQDAASALEIPFVTKKRLGHVTQRSWVIMDEVNRFVWPGPDLRPISRSESDRFDYGLLPPSFFKQLRDKLIAGMKSQKLKNIPRTK